MVQYVVTAYGTVFCGSCVGEKIFYVEQSPVALDVFAVGHSGNCGLVYSKLVRYVLQSQWNKMPWSFFEKFQLDAYYLAACPGNGVLSVVECFDYFLGFLKLLCNFFFLCVISRCCSRNCEIVLVYGQLRYVLV